MSRLEMLRPLRDAFRGEQRRPTVILLASPVLLITWVYCGSSAFYLEHLAGSVVLWNDPAATAGAYTFLAAFVLLGVVPALIVKLVFGESLADYGVGLGNRKRTVRTFLLWAPVFLLVAYLASRDPHIADYYPINKSAGKSPALFGWHACFYAMFYVGYEFHFRGFTQLGLRKSLGDVNALLVQVLGSTLVHVGRPVGETYGAVAAGVLWGALAYRTRSLLSGLLQHFLLGLSLDWFLCYG